MINNKPLLRSGVGNHIWKIAETDPERFKVEVRRYFALTMPGWEVVKVTAKERIVWLKEG